MAPSMIKDDPLLLLTYLAKLRAIQAHAARALESETIDACEEALDAIADIACDEHDDEDGGD